jgi:hypothetical protein
MYVTVTVETRKEYRLSTNPRQLSIHSNPTNYQRNLTAAELIKASM